MRKAINTNSVISEPTKVTPHQAVKLLKKHKVIVTLEQAEKILEFMDRLAKLAIEHYVK
jgi:hypothetical protein